MTDKSAFDIDDQFEKDAGRTIRVVGYSVIFRNLAVAALALMFCWLGWELRKETIARKGEMFAASAQLKQDSHLLAMDGHALAMVGGTAAAQQNLYWASAGLQSARLMGQGRHLMAELQDTAVEFHGFMTNFRSQVNTPGTGLLAQLTNAVAGLRPLLDASTDTLKDANALVKTHSAEEIQKDARVQSLADIARSILLEMNAGTVQGKETMAKLNLAAEQLRLTGVDAREILDGLAHPEQPGRFVRYLGYAIQLFRITGSMGQSGLPPFNKR